MLRQAQHEREWQIFEASALAFEKTCKNVIL